MKISTKPLIALGAFLALLVILVHASTNFYQDAVERTVAPGRPEVIGESEGLVALAWVDEGEAPSSRALRLWVLFENRSKADVRNLRFLVFYTPGFDKTGKCWAQEAPACRPSAIPDRPYLGLPKSLKPGESAVVFARLKPKSWYGYHGASGVLAWQDADGKTWQRAVVLPAVPVSSDRGRVLASLGKSIDLLKDLALPIALLLFGTYLQRRDRERENAEKERDRDRQTEQDERARQQTLLRETWTLMLPKVHAYAEAHYMPLIVSIEGFRNPKKDETERFFELLRLLRRARKFAQTVGGLFFKSRKGEDLAGDTWGLFLQKVRRALVREDLERAMLVIDPDENYASFLDKLKTGDHSALLGRLRKRLVTWEGSKDFEREAAFADLYGHVLFYEMNRPYEIWYGEPAQLDVAKLTEAVNCLDPGDSSLAELKQRLADYVRRYQGSKSGGDSGTQVPQPSIGLAMVTTSEGTISKAGDQSNSAAPTEKGTAQTGPGIPRTEV